MKKVLILLLFCIILASSSTVYGGKSIFLDFEDREQYIVPLFKGDRVYFEYDGDEHTVILDELKVKSGRIELDIFLYQKGKFKHANPSYAPLDPGHSLRIDIDKDDFFDLIIDLDDFDKDKAILRFSSSEQYKYVNLTTVVKPTNGGNVITTDEKKFYEDFGVLGVVFGIVVLVVVVLVIDSLIRKRKGIYY